MIVSTWSFGQRANAAAWPILEASGSALDAVEAAAIAVERDPEVDSVGRGGLPDADGRVTVDASVMLSPSQHGSVAAINNMLSPTTLARAVMEETDHAMLVGAGAEAFARGRIEPIDLLTGATRARYARWRSSNASEKPDQTRDSGRGLRPVDRGAAGLFRHTGDLTSGDRWVHHDTIGSLAIDSRGVMAGACSTSGTPFKHPGRVGDSPIVGHGLYVDPEVGGAVATGSGELMMGVCATFLVVELIRNGAHLDEAIREVLVRIQRTHDIRPDHQAALIVLRPDGVWSAGSLRNGFRVAVRTGTGDEICEPTVVLRDD